MNEEFTPSESEDIYIRTVWTERTKWVKDGVTERSEGTLWLTEGKELASKRTIVSLRSEWRRPLGRLRVNEVNGKEKKEAKL